MRFKLVAVLRSSKVRAAVAAAALVVGLAGAVAVRPVSAEAAQHAAQKDARAADAPPGRRRPGAPGAPVFLDVKVAAGVIGVGVDDLAVSLRQGRTLADLAAEHDVSEKALVDALVAAADDRLEELRTSMPDRIAEIVKSGRTPRDAGPGPAGRRPGRPASGAGAAPFGEGAARPGRDGRGSGSGEGVRGLSHDRKAGPARPLGELDK